MDIIQAAAVDPVFIIFERHEKWNAFAAPFFVP